MKTKECNIVQDLLPNYIEGLVSRETSEFVKKHIDECEYCINKYILVKEDDAYKRENIQIEDEIEHNHLKKVKSKITQTRVTVLVVVVLSLIINTTLGIKYFGERKILSEINNRYENLKTLDNYTITRKTLEINYETKECSFNSPDMIKILEILCILPLIGQFSKIFTIIATADIIISMINNLV